MFWIFVFVIGGAIEEVWRAFSIQALQWIGWSPAVTVLVSSAAFVYANLSGIPGRIPGRPGTEVGWQFLLGCALASLFLVTGLVAIPFLVGLIFNCTNLFLIRHGWRAPRSRVEALTEV
jgi:hypothetical protein